jgi:D-alanine-D-alanine ligase
MKKTRVLVLCGGKSAERQVSLVSARTVLQNLDARKYEADLVQIDAAGRWLRADPKVLTARVQAPGKDLAPASRALAPADRLSPRGRTADVVFPVLHGTLGEDGTIQGLLEVAGVPYVGCGVLASALGMDKEVSKRVAQAAGLPILPYEALTDGARAAEAAARLGYPVFVKPARLGSSVGISKVKRPEDLARAVKEAFKYDEKVIVEKGVEAREIEVAVLGDPAAPEGDASAAAASEVGEIVPNAEFYDYKAKYLDENGARLLIPAELPADRRREVQRLGLLAFRAHDGYGLSRVDFLLDKRSGTLHFNEIHTIPDCTSGSMYTLL